MRLTSKRISGLRLPAGKTDEITFDDDLAGFGVRLREGGSRVWVYQYRIGRKQRRMVLGSTKALSLAQARETAATLAAKVKLGGDPAMLKEVARRDAENTFGAMISAFLESRNGDWRPRTAGEAKRHLELYARPLHGLPLTAVSLRDVAALLDKLARESGATTANRVRASLSSFFAWIIQQGISLPQGNPVASTQKRKEAARDRVLTDVELRAIWSACGDDDYGLILKLLALTGQRAGEIGLLRWDEVFDEQIVLPAERTKNARAHIVPLSEPAKAILSGRKDRTFVFGGRDTGFKGWSKAKAKLDAQVKIAPWTPHDLRRTAATGMAGIGIAPHIVEAVLNHVTGSRAGVAGIYNRATYDKEKREALNVWAEHVLAAVEGRAPTIVPLKRA